MNCFRFEIAYAMEGIVSISRKPLSMHAPEGLVDAGGVHISTFLSSWAWSKKKWVRHEETL